MSTVYTGPQGPSYETDELLALYDRAMDSLHAEDPNHSGSRTPVVATNSPVIQRDTSPYDPPSQGAPFSPLSLADA